MENLDSDNESECFESAEESLDEDENEEKDKNCKIKKSFIKSESEVVELVVPVSDASDSVFNAEEENVSNDSLAYRKRPERFRRLSSKSPPKIESSTKISRPSDSIFKTDKIAPDVFFQDITSNLSKNINKSLNTLHQTSSNVKDLILSSLPVVSVNEKEGFSYDGDRSVFPASVDENQSQETAQNEVFVNDKSEKSVDIVPSEDNKKIESLKEEIIVENLSDSLKRKKNVSAKSKKNNLEKDKEKEPSKGGKSKVKQNKLEKVKKEKSEVIESSKKAKSKKVCNCIEGNDLEKDCGLPDCINKKTKLTKPKTENTDLNNVLVKRKEDVLEVLKEKCSKEIINNENFIKSEMSSLHNDTCAQIIKDIGEDSYQISGENDASLIKTGEITETKETDCEDDQIDTSQKSLQPAPLQISSDDWDDFIPEESEEIEEKDSKGDWDDFVPVPEENAIPPPECNLEELKSVLKQMVPEETEENDIKEKSTVFEPQPEITEVAENSNDGWEDFDFSDNEIENCAIEESNPEKEKSKVEGTQKESKVVVVRNKTKGKQKASPLKSSGKGSDVKNLRITGKSVLLKEDKMNTEELKCGAPEEGKPAKSDIRNLRVTGESVFQKGEKLKNEEIKLKGEGRERGIEEGKREKDDWGWDNWDEDLPAHEQQVKDFTKHEKKGATEEELFGESRWSGWDTFGVKPEEKQGNWNISSWGVNMLLNKATAVTQGISNVLEAGLGAPDPETLARMEKLENEKLREKGRNEGESKEPPAEVSKKNSLTDVNLFPGFGITSLVAGVTSKIVEHSKIQEIGSKVITGGLDTLETFGKKTMEVLQEGDPGLKNKRALLMGSNKPVLSQVLKEAREKADRELKKVEEKEIAKKCHFETLFDDFQGMVHLEALEMLSRQCEIKLEQIRSSMNAEEQEDLDGILEEVEQLCSLDEYDPNSSSLIDFKISLNMAVESLKDEISIKQIIQIYENVVKWLQTSSDTKPSATAIYQKIVSTLAELTAATVHQFHKAGELLSVKECRKTVEEVDALSRMTSVLCTEIQKLCEKFVALSKSNKESSENASSVAEKVDVVMKNSTSYIRQAFNLLIPIVQTGAAV